MNNGISKWFGLGRPNFILNPQTDASFYAPRSHVNVPVIVESLRVNLVTELPPKRLFWGLYGGGKTHTLFKVAKELEALTPIHVVYVECPNVAKKSTFLHLYHDGIMASMGQDWTVDLFVRYVDQLVSETKTIRREVLLPRVQQDVSSEELARSIVSLSSGETERKLLFWRYISGVEVAKADLPDLGQTQDLIEAEPSKLADIIVAIGKVVGHVHKRTLVLILDELDRLEYVGDETGSTFQNAFRRLVDDNQRDVSILMGCSAGNLKEDLPAIFGGEYGPVLSRIGQTNLLEVPEINPNDIDNFIRAIIGFVRGSTDDVQARVKEVQKDTKETVDSDFFPFTRDAIEALKGTMQGIMTPREATQRMTHAAGKAYLMKRRVITRDVIG